MQWCTLGIGISLQNIFQIIYPKLRRFDPLTGSCNLTEGHSCL
jgi:hypothetical protein